MNEGIFWYIIEVSKKFAQKPIQNTLAHNELQYRFIVEELKYYNPSEIIEFERIFRRLINRATCHNIEDWIFESDDGMLYFKCWLISQGRFFFSNAIYHPRFLAYHKFKDQSDEFGRLLYASTEAFLEVTGKSDEDSECPRVVCYYEKLDYDYYPVDTQGVTLTKGEIGYLGEIEYKNSVE